MKLLLYILLCLLPASAMGSVYTIIAPHVTMHVGDPVPPLIFNVMPSLRNYAGVFVGEPGRSTSATSSSPAGNYPIHLERGSLRTVNPDDGIRLVDGVLSIIPADRIGAKLVNNIEYPPGFFQGPSSYPVLDVTKNATSNLIGDCKTDNAAAFNLLLSQNGQRTSGTTNGGTTPLFLYFPPGCYATSQPLSIYGNTWTLWGSGPQRSYIRLLPNSPGFDTGKPTPFFNPHSVTKNSNFREYIYNLGFNIGVGNPDAIPFTTVQNNSGAVRNVQIWADDARCPTAISFDRQYPGPMLFKDVAVYGCKAAYSSSQNEYNVTFENFTTEAQTEIALDDHYIATSIRHWLSDNTVPALHINGRVTAEVAVLDSEILNGAPNATGITVDEGAAVYLADLAASGYGVTELDAGAGTPLRRTGSITQAWTGSAQSIFNVTEQPDSLHLPVRETPDPQDPPASAWTELDGHAENWPAQIQHGSSATLYTPPGIYQPIGVLQITVPDSVNHLQFYNSKFPTGASQIILTIAGSSRMPLVIDGCPYQSCQIVHTGSRAIVIRDTTLSSYEARDGAGDVYIEDSMLNIGARGGPAVTFYRSQHVWARQLNLEQRNSDKLHCLGCTMWILGYKTEQPTPSLVMTDRAQAEIFGFFFYMNVGPSVTGSTHIHLTGSSLFAFGWAKVDVPGRGHPNWIIEDQKGRSSSLATASVDTSQQLNMFYSYGGGVPNRELNNGKDARPKN